MLIWSEKFVTGDPRVDDQHRQLFDRLNELLQAAREGRPKEQVEGMMAFLAGYVRTHFSYEEDCMHRLQCPVHTTNKSAHERFSGELGSLRRRLQSDGVTPNLVLDIRIKLVEWFVHHVGNVDHHLAPCISRSSRPA